MKPDVNCELLSRTLLDELWLANELLSDLTLQDGFDRNLLGRALEVDGAERLS